MPSVLRAQQANWEASQMADFPERMIEEIKKVKANVVRIHVAGDLYDAEYTHKWRKIIKACPDVRFFLYTRSWHKPRIYKALVKLITECRNLRMWFSVDAELAPLLRGDNAVKVPRGVRLAYMTISPADIPNRDMDLVFRDYAVRNLVQKRVNGIAVCPPENGITKTNCESCGICWRNDKAPKLGPPNRTIPLIPLKMVA